MVIKNSKKLVESDTPEQKLLSVLFGGVKSITIPCCKCELFHKQCFPHDGINICEFGYGKYETSKV